MVTNPAMAEQSAQNASFPGVVPPQLFAPPLQNYPFQPTTSPIPALPAPPAVTVPSFSKEILESTTNITVDNQTIKLGDWARGQIAQAQQQQKEQRSDYLTQIKEARNNENRTNGLAFGATTLSIVANTIQNCLTSTYSLEAYSRSCAANEKISGDRKDVEIAYASVQEHAVEAQVKMHNDEMRHQETMQRLTNSCNVQLAYLQEDFKTDRMRIALTAGAFRPNDWFQGSPALY